MGSYDADKRTLPYLTPSSNIAKGSCQQVAYLNDNGDEQQHNVRQAPDSNLDTGKLSIDTVPGFEDNNPSKSSHNQKLLQDLQNEHRWNCQNDRPPTDRVSTHRTDGVPSGVRRGFRGTLASDSGHVTATTTRQKIAMRIYGNQKPIEEKDLREINSTRSLPTFQLREPRRKSSSSSSSSGGRALPSLCCKQLHVSLSNLPVEHKSAELFQKRSSFMPRLPANGVSRLSANNANQGLFPRSWHAVSRTPPSIPSQQRHRRGSLSSLLLHSAAVKPQTDTKRPTQTAQILKQKTKILHPGFFGSQSRAGSNYFEKCQEELLARLEARFSKHRKDPSLPVHPTLALIPLPDEAPTTRTQSRPSTSGVPVAGDHARNGGDSNLTSCNLVEPESEYPWPMSVWSMSCISGETTETESRVSLRDTNSEQNELALSNSNGDAEPSRLVGNARMLQHDRKSRPVLTCLPPILSSASAKQVSPRAEKIYEENRLSLPPLPSGINRKQSNDHDADDERESTLDLTNRRVRLRCQRNSAAAGGTSTSENTRHQDRAMRRDNQNLPASLDDDGQYDKYARARRKGWRARRRQGNSPPRIRSESSSSLITITKKKKVRKKPRKKKQTGSQVPLTGLASSSHMADPQDGDDERDDEDDEDFRL